MSIVFSASAQIKLLRPLNVSITEELAKAAYSVTLMLAMLVVTNSCYVRQNKTEY